MSQNSCLEWQFNLDSSNGGTHIAQKMGVYVLIFVSYSTKLFSNMTM